MINALYLLAPNPFKKNNPYKNFNKIHGIIFWILQKICINFILKKSCGVIVCSELVIEYLKNENIKTNNFLIIHGGLDLSDLRDSMKKFGDNNKIYDGCFFWKIASSKGPLEMIEIWKKVINYKPNAKLAIIGNGTEEKKLRI